MSPYFPSDKSNDDFEDQFEDMPEEDSSSMLAQFGVGDLIDHEILMHRDSHFGGLFPEMIDYYNQEGVGINPEFEIQRIHFLAKLEEEIGENLAPLLLSGPEAERVGRSRDAYKQLRDLYELPARSHSHLLADLVLSEEEEPEEEVSKIVKIGSSIVPGLIELLKNEEFSDPLFPGYGRARQLAAICLGKLAEERAVVPFFEALGREDFELDAEILNGLRQIGSASTHFLLQILQSRPLTRDNEKAAMALTAFIEDPKVAKMALRQLEDPQIRSHPELVSYLVLACEGLKDPEDQALFKSFANSPAFPTSLKADAQLIINSWK